MDFRPSNFQLCPSILDLLSGTGQTDRRTDGRTDGRTDRHTDRETARDTELSKDLATVDELDGGFTEEEIDEVTDLVR